MNQRSAILWMMGVCWERSKSVYIESVCILCTSTQGFVSQVKMWFWLQIHSGFPNMFSCTKVIWNLIHELKRQLRNDPNIFGFSIELFYLVWNLLSKHVFLVFKYQLGLLHVKSNPNDFNIVNYQPSLEQRVGFHI